jgi:hypothetical protein
MLPLLREQRQLSAENIGKREEVVMMRRRRRFNNHSA